MLTSEEDIWTEFLSLVENRMVTVYIGGNLASRQIPLK